MPTDQPILKCSKGNCIYSEKYLDPKLTTDEKSCSLNKDYRDYLKKLVANSFKYINIVLISYGSLAGIILLSKIYKITEIEWNNIKIPLSDSWIIFSIFTVAHIYFGWNLIKSLKKVENVRCDSLRKEIYMEITSSENIFINGLNPRPILSSAISKSLFIKFDKKDLSFWFRAIIQVAVIIAIIDFSKSTVFPFLESKTLVIGLLIVMINSYAGSYYLVRFYMLAYSINNWGLNLIEQTYD